MSNTKLLQNLYESNKDALYSVAERCDDHMLGPFLIAPNDLYWNAKIKVAFVGQETFSWTDHDTIEAQMGKYTEFNLGISYCASPFWNVIRKLESGIIGSEYCSGYLNVNRYDEHGGRPSYLNQKVLQEVDYILVEELKILNPDFTIFLTGPDYDWRVTELLKCAHLEIPGFTTRQLCRLETSAIPGTVLRTYHPRYLRQGKLEDSVVATIIEFAKSLNNRA